MVVHGRVQGVFFRDSTRRRAVAENVAGWIRNRGDGTVEAVFEGDASAIARLVRYCEEGPRGAQVDHVERFTEDPEGLTGFRIV